MLYVTLYVKDNCVYKPELRWQKHDSIIDLPSSLLRKLNKLHYAGHVHCSN